MGRDDGPHRRSLAVDPAGAIRGPWTPPSASPEGVIYGLLLYWIDNEIHHRGQGYAYLRSLEIDPPLFYDRS